MKKMTGTEPVKEIPPKVLLLYEAVMQLIGEGADINEMRVSAITERAGIGKGTAYDYFDSKEEIIACAIVYHISRLSEEMNEKLLSMGGLQEQLEFLFDRMDEEKGRKTCFVRFVHLMTDNSRFSQLMQQKINESSVGKNFPEYFFGKIIQQGQNKGEIRSDIPMEYLVYTVYCKVITYMMCINSEEKFGSDMQCIRPLVKEGILRELQG